MQNEIIVKIIAEKRIRFETKKTENEFKRADSILQNLTMKDFEGCAPSMDITKIMEIKEAGNADNT